MLDLGGVVVEDVVKEKHVVLRVEEAVLVVVVTISETVSTELV